jgi:putative tricarboxylic transport membrane protein
MEFALQSLSLASDSWVAIEILTQNILWIIIGILLGMFFGAIPGLGGTVAISIILPFTLALNKFEAFIVLAGAMGAVTFSGSVTAILVNTPGTGGNAATLLDGYPLTKQGQAARAISISATASALGALVGLVFFFLLIPIVIEIALLFGPSQVFWLALIGISVIPLVSGENVLAGLAMGGFGLILAFTGRALSTGELRYTYGLLPLYNGVPLVPVVVGLFAIAEMLKLTSSGEDAIAAGGEEFSVKEGRITGIKDVIKHRWLTLRCSIIGILIGIVPGIGGGVATFVSYGHAVSSSSDPDGFGKGKVEGIIASEAANDSKDGGQLFPTLGLGIPGSATTAILLAGFLMHGIIPGPDLLREELHLMLVIVFTLLISNIVTSLIGLSLLRFFTVITRIPVSLLFPAIVAVSLASVFVMSNSFADMVLALLFGLLGVVLISLDVSRIPIIMALILGDIMEDNYHTARIMFDGVIPGLFYGPLNQILIIALVLSLTLPIWIRLGIRIPGISKK